MKFRKLMLAIGLAVILPLTLRAQVESTQQVIGGQIGFLGAWAYGEFPVKHSSVIRGEIGLDGGIRGGSFFDEVTYAAAPSFTVEPRHYYNFDKRVAKGKSVYKNSANFVSLRATAQPGWFLLSTSEGTITDRGIILMPTWGIRRYIKQKVSVEAGLGIGYTRRWFENGDLRLSSWTTGLHLRLGI